MKAGDLVRFVKTTRHWEQGHTQMDDLGIVLKLNPTTVQVYTSNKVVEHYSSRWEVIK